MTTRVARVKLDLSNFAQVITRPFLNSHRLRGDGIAAMIAHRHERVYPHEFGLLRAGLKSPGKSSAHR